MSSVAKAASTKVDWARIISLLGLTGSTAASLSAFKKRYDDAIKLYQALNDESTTIDFAHYRRVLKNSKIVDEIEAKVTLFKPVTYDVAKTIKSIDVFEASAVENAKATEKVILQEIDQLQTTLKEIQAARPFDQLTVDDVAAARPDLDERVKYMITHGKWNVPGYKEKFGDLTVM